MSGTLVWDIGGREYELDVEDFTLGSSGSWDDPPELPEIELSSVVHVTTDLDGYSVVPFGVFLLYLAADRNGTLEETLNIVTDSAIEHETDRIAAMYDDCEP